MKSRHLSLAVSLMLGAALGLGSACGSVPDDRKVLPEGYDDQDASSDGGRGGAGGSSASGGKGGAPDAGEDSGQAGGKGGAGGTVTEVDGGKVCGSTLCSSISASIGSDNAVLPACCTGADDERCGLDFSGQVSILGCIELNAPGTDNVNCQAQSDPDDGTYAGCCRTDTGTCGVVWAPSTTLNFGCVDPVNLGFSAGTSCTAPACTADNAECSTSAECCDKNSPHGVVCVGFDDSSRCEQYCEKNSECKSGCCITLVSGFGACSPNADDCSASCRAVDESCDTDKDCCTGTVCVSNGTRGPKICATPCTTAANCAPEFCVTDAASGHKACSSTGAGLCSDTCTAAKNGKCEDGGPSSSGIGCALGTDCTDCAKVGAVTARLGGVYLCNDGCDTASNGKCEDGGSGAGSFTCNWGSDCTDCKPRLGICSDDCPFARNGICDDGGANAADARCATGTDCTDCSTRWGGRAQSPCDGTAGTLCNPNGQAWLGKGDDKVCQCNDCKWDQKDCGGTDRCDGKAIMGCCDANNSCDLADDNYCDCNGWCSWETSDCGTATTTVPGAQ